MPVKGVRGNLYVMVLPAEHESRDLQSLPVTAGQAMILLLGGVAELQASVVQIRTKIGELSTALDFVKSNVAQHLLK